MTNSNDLRSGSRIRQDFLNFFKSKQHTIVPSSGLMPDSPNLLFTNAGMNQFVPIFLGQVKCPYNPPRAADTQKCIRAGGKHNDLEDVGLDTYHHTFFEMLGNWSFGDYFKKEAIEWAWELITEVWKFPKDRLYATVFCPDMDTAQWNEGLTTAIEFAKIRIQGGTAKYGQEVIGGTKGRLAMGYPDDESASLWAEHFLRAGIDPLTHIVPGNRKDNFWMMGETGPCGPCSELHVDLTAAGDTKGSLVNKGDARCIEIWNLVFIQFNANPDGSFSPLPAKHVDTGMGFERVTSIIQGTKGFKDFANAKISNYETDIFRPIFDALQKLSKKKYCSTLPTDGRSADGVEMIAHAQNPQLQVDVAFRVIADHIRTLSFAIADGIQPGNDNRNYVLRRILRRAVRYGRTLGFHEPFFYKLVDVLAETMGDVFPEIRARKKNVQEVIQREEEAFNKTLDDGIELFQKVTGRLYDLGNVGSSVAKFLETVLTGTPTQKDQTIILNSLAQEAAKLAHIDYLKFFGKEPNSFAHKCKLLSIQEPNVSSATELRDSITALLGVAKDFTAIKNIFPGRGAFVLSDTYGFPLDLTELMAREYGLTVDVDGFNKLMDEQKARARAAQKKEVVSLSQVETTTPTKFIGYDALDTPAKVLEVVSMKDKTAVILDASTCYAEMGGQVGDAGEIYVAADVSPRLTSERTSAVFSRTQPHWKVVNTQKSGNTWLHFITDARSDAPRSGAEERGALLRESDLPTVGSTVTLSVEKPRRHAIERHHTVTHLLHWALHEVVSHDASQKGSFVGPDKLTFDFNSPAFTPAQIADIEKLVNERILENAGVSWTEVPHADMKNRKDVMQFFGDKYGDTVRVVQIGGHAAKLDGYSMELCGGTHTRATGEIGLFRIVGESAIAAGVRRIEAVAGLEAYRRANEELQLIKSLAGKVSSPVHELDKKIDSLLAHQKELEKALKATQQREASNAASELLERVQTLNGVPAIIHNVGGVDGDFLQAVADSLKGRFKGVIVLGGSANGAVALVASVSPDFTAKVQAGKIIQAIAPIVGGKGGGKPDNARGGGKDASKLEEALAKVKSLLG